MQLLKYASCIHICRCNMPKVVIWTDEQVQQLDGLIARGISKRQSAKILPYSYQVVARKYDELRATQRLTTRAKKTVSASLKKKLVTRITKKLSRDQFTLSSTVISNLRAISLIFAISSGIRTMAHIDGVKDNI